MISVTKSQSDSPHKCQCLQNSSGSFSQPTWKYSSPLPSIRLPVETVAVVATPQNKYVMSRAVYFFYVSRVCICYVQGRSLLSLPNSVEACSVFSGGSWRPQMTALANISFLCCCWTMSITCLRNLTSYPVPFFVSLHNKILIFLLYFPDFLLDTWSGILVSM